jgi:DNA-binding response OmpR family regulator
VKASFEKSNVKVVVTDDEALMRGIVLNALGAGGYRDIKPAANFEQLEQIVDGTFPDLLVVSGEMADGDALAFVRRLRMHRIGRNPFVPVIMTAWNAEQSFVRKIVDAGADVLVMKPFAAAQLYTKIEFLCSDRPPFVVTSSYLGPDRRKASRGDDFPSFNVPNTLTDRLNGERFDREELLFRISSAFAAMMRQRRIFQEQDIRRSFTAMADAARERRPASMLKGEIGSMIQLAKRYVDEGASADRQDGERSVDALVEILRNVVDADDRVSLQDCDAVERLFRKIGIAVPSAIERAVLCDNVGLTAAR